MKHPRLANTTRGQIVCFMVKTFCKYTLHVRRRVVVEAKAKKRKTVRENICKKGGERVLETRWSNIHPSDVLRFISAFETSQASAVTSINMFSVCIYICRSVCVSIFRLDNIDIQYVSVKGHFMWLYRSICK